MFIKGNQKCCFCGEDTGKYGNNSQPLSDEESCFKCNYHIVVPYRMGAVVEIKKEYFKGIESNGQWVTDLNFDETLRDKVNPEVYYRIRLVD